MNLGKRIKGLRESAGITQAELAKKAGRSQEHICRIENGNHNPTTKTLDKICAALGISLAELFSESEE